MKMFKMQKDAGNLILPLRVAAKAALKQPLKRSHVDLNAVLSNIFSLLYIIVNTPHGSIYERVWMKNKSVREF